MKKLALILMLIPLAATGCGVQKASGSGSNSSTASNDPKADVIQASQKFMALGSLIGSIDATGETPFKKQVEFVAPDRYHVIYRDESGADLEMLIVGNESFLRSGDTWTKIPGEESPIPTLRTEFSEDEMKTVSDVQFVGDDVVDGKPALVYKYKCTTLIGDFPTTSTVWISKISGLPLKSHEEYASGVVKSRTTTFDTEKQIDIQLPAVKK